MKWPQPYRDEIEDTDLVSVLMTESMARRFERRCLGTNTNGVTALSPPLKFSADDLPTYIIETEGRRETAGTE